MHNKVARGISAWRIIPKQWHMAIRSRMCWLLSIGNPLPLEDKAPVNILVLGAGGHNYPL